MGILLLGQCPQHDHLDFDIAGLTVQSGLQHAQGILAAAIGQEYLGFADGVDAPGALDAQASLPASPHPIQAERGK